MSEVTVKVKDISKEYRIGETNEFRTMRENITKSISGGVKKLLSNIKRNGHAEASVEKITQKDNFFWSLRDISFNVTHGEIVGIIGRNGAGKSTLLKIITGITEPTDGRIDIYGRIASLLEVGTGFHLELTGRENIYLNGAILGMKKREIDRKFDEILDFSEVEKFIDTPVKYYSSGMRVRLGFSVAAHLEPEILLIDEVLAVGDAAFQKKCLGKLNNVATSEGRTVLFVSHDMTAILSLCQRAVLLEHGRLVGDGSTEQIIQEYMQTIHRVMSTPLEERQDRGGDQSVILSSLAINNRESGKQIIPGAKINIAIGYKSSAPVRYCSVEITIRDYRTNIKILYMDSETSGGIPVILPPSGTILCVIEDLFITPGRCIVDVTLKRASLKADIVTNATYFDIDTTDFYGSGKVPDRVDAMTLCKYSWLTE